MRPEVSMSEHYNLNEASFCSLGGGGGAGGRSSVSVSTAGGGGGGANFLPLPTVSGGAPSQQHSSGGTGGGALPARFDEDVEIPLVKVVVLGAPGVGKTSLVKRFVSNDFNPDHVRTSNKSEHFPSLILNDSLFELKLIDLPPIPHFPLTTEAEWREYRFFGLRSASAYILVYDSSRPSTFQYVRTLRDQMVGSRDMTNVPVIVAANKTDLNTSSSNSSKEISRLRKEVVSLVRKQWRSGHVECSARFNFNVMAVFKELAVTLDMIAHGQVIGAAQNNGRKRRCLMF